jgi:hypothetical protein
MPQSNREVAEFDLRSDMNSYYRHSVVTYLYPNKDGTISRYAAWINEFHGNNDELTASIKVLKPENKDYSALFDVPIETLDFTMPPLGLVKVDKNWWLPTRSPQRRMRKGYNNECVQLSFLEGAEYAPVDGLIEANLKTVIKQLWYGNEERIALNLVVWGKGIYYMTDKVADINDEGVVSLIPNKEKLGELSCKILANNWDTVLSKTIVRILPSSPQMPLV